MNMHYEKQLVACAHARDVYKQRKQCIHVHVCIIKLAETEAKFLARDLHVVLIRRWRWPWKKKMARKAPSLVVGRWCMICDVQIVTQKHYTNLQSTKAKVNRSELQEQFRNVLGDEFTLSEEDHSSFACDKCVVKVKRASTLTVLVRELKENFEKTKRNHRPIDQPGSRPGFDDDDGDGNGNGTRLSGGITSATTLISTPTPKPISTTATRTSGISVTSTTTSFTPAAPPPPPPTTTTISRSSTSSATTTTTCTTYISSVNSAASTSAAASITPTKSVSQQRSKRMASISPGGGTPSSKVKILLGSFY